MNDFIETIKLGMHLGIGGYIGFMGMKATTELTAKGLKKFWQLFKECCEYEGKEE